MKFILAEKSSVGKDIGEALGVKFRYDNHLLCDGGYIVAWARGHLLEVDNEATMSDMKTFPKIPEKLIHMPIDNAKEILNNIKGLVKGNKVEEFIIATDAGREGELIARLIIEYIGYKGKVSRIWTSEAWTKNVIKKQLDNLKDDKEFDSLYYSAVGRQYADWVVGINLSTIFNRNMVGKWSVGRVQTPLMSEIAKRCKSIEEFDITEFYKMECVFSVSTAKGDIDITVQSENRYTLEEAGKIDLDKLTIKDYVQKKKVKEIVAPELFSLTDLQKHMNSNFKWKADDTLTVAQALYSDHHILSYPRTESNYLGEDESVIEKFVNVISVLSGESLSDVQKICKKYYKQLFNSSKLTDHYAIIVDNTENINKKLSPEESKLLNEVKRRMLCRAYYPIKANQSNIDLVVDSDIDFKLKGSTVTEDGWLKFDESKREDYDFNQLLVEKINKITIKQTQMVKSKTKPPAYYNDASLLGWMKKNNLGTPATRASMLKIIQDREYVTLQKNEYRVTEKGKKLFGIIDGHKISQVELTSELEVQLEEIWQSKKGKQELEKFNERIVSFTTDSYASFDKILTGMKSEMYKCPVCKGSVVLSGMLFKCKTDGCGFGIWRKLLGAYLRDCDIEALLSGEKVLVKDMVSKKTGNKFTANVYIDSDGSLKFEFINDKNKKYEKKNDTATASNDKKDDDDIMA